VEHRQRAYLQGLGFPALATTSSGYAHSQGYADGALSLDQVLAHFHEIAVAADVPLNADFEDGLAGDLDGLAQNVTRCIATGVAGLSIEDSPGVPLYDLDTALARVKAARRQSIAPAATWFSPRARKDLSAACPILTMSSGA